MVDAVCQVSGFQLGFGITSVLSGTLAFFPVGTYKPWYLGWSTKIAAPIWVGVLVGTTISRSWQYCNHFRIQTSNVVCTLWELSYIFSILCGLTAPLQFAIAVTSIVLGPYCYYSFQGAVGTGYLAHAAKLPYPYLAFPALCLDPKHLEWYHLALHTTDLLTSLAMFTLSFFIIVILTLRVLRSGHVNVS
ncbi:transmembrane protein 212 [Clupea harengus]|uniref:Transmembrane protein 212 n=1 Tax=Clupea harengus TaxID=7950 RepID=A0A6P8EJJ7_CLUHA|nr:transmembrane protein 212 [Clupea harengus]